MTPPAMRVDVSTAPSGTRLVAAPPSATTAIELVPVGGADVWLARQEPITTAWCGALGFRASPGAVIFIPDAGGRLSRVVAAWDERDGPWAVAALPDRLPPGVYRIDPELPPRHAADVALGWALGAYRVRPDSSPDRARLVWPVNADRSRVERLSAAMYLARDLVNMPPNELGPAELADVASALAATAGARCSEIVGDDLPRHGYHAIHAAGAGSARVPRVVDFVWGNGDAPFVTLVGKGVCFDSGGLNLKPSSSLQTMKRDMGGAAIVLALAQAMIAAALPVRLRVLIAAFENSVSGTAYRPSDVLPTRRGATVEVTSTDAEGRLALAELLAEADDERPGLLVDCATLTGAARAALGPDLAAIFSNDDALAADLAEAAALEGDPVWRLPLWQPYQRLLESPVATFRNSSESGLAAPIVAALYLQQFISPETPWLHLDLMAWNVEARPGRPVGGEGTALRALYRLMEMRVLPAATPRRPVEPASAREHRP